MPALTDLLIRLGAGSDSATVLVKANATPATAAVIGNQLSATGNWLPMTAAVAVHDQHGLAPSAKRSVVGRLRLRFSGRR